MPQNQTTENKTEEIKLDRKSKILFAVLAVLIAGSVAATFWRYIVKRDYVIESQADCDPEAENCFVWKCDPVSPEEGEECTGLPDKDIWYYKILRRNAKNIPLCDPNDENCEALSCPETESDCEEIFCSPENVKPDEECITPEQYLLENPPEEEEEECAPDDEECAAAATETEEECAPDDAECAAGQEESGDETQENSQEKIPSADQIPPGVEPM
jgi:hypothetical protein